jgi:hypothetical protein
MKEIYVLIINTLRSIYFNPSGITKEVHFGTKRTFLFTRIKLALMRKEAKKAEPCAGKVDFMLGMSPSPGKRALLVIPKFTLDLGNNLGRTLRRQGGLYAWNESITRKTSFDRNPKIHP